MTRPFFTRNRISHFNIFDRHAEHVITQMKSRLRAGYPVDFQVCSYRSFSLPQDELISLGRYFAVYP